MVQSRPVFIDCTTLSSFAIVGRLDLLRRAVEGHQPHWTEAVVDEVTEGVNVGRVPTLRSVIDAGWLGEPWRPAARDLKAIYVFQVGLCNGQRPPIGNRGEAEGFRACHVTGGSFVTDDGPALAFARNMSPPVEVRDTVRVLQDAVTLGSATSDECWEAVDAMLQASRSIRRGDVSRNDFN